MEKLFDSADLQVNIGIAEKVISTFVDNFNALNVYMLDANKEMGQAEMPEVNEMVQDPAAVEE